MPMSPLLHVDNPQCRYDQLLTLREVSFTVNEGEILALIGPNGAGKTTLLRAISGLHPPSGGRIVFRDRDITRLPAEAIVRLGISHVPEGRRLFPGLSVLDNLEMGAVASRRRAWRDDAEAVFALFPMLAERRHQMAWSLSGGQQQMLALGRALMAKPRLLLLDEPSLGLAPLMVQDVFKHVIDINRQGTTIVLAEQNARIALKIAHRGLVLVNGSIVLQGDATVLSEDERVKALYLGGH